MRTRPRRRILGKLHRYSLSGKYLIPLRTEIGGTFFINVSTQTGIVLWTFEGPNDPCIFWVLYLGRISSGQQGQVGVY